MTTPTITLTGTLTTTLAWVHKETEAVTTNLNNTITDTGYIYGVVNFTSGTGEQAVNEVYHDRRVLPSGGSETLDLTSLSQSVYGNEATVSFSKVKAIVIRNTNENLDNEIQVETTGNGFGEPWGYPTGALTIYPNSSLVGARVLDGFTIDSSNREITVTDSSGSGVTYEIGVVGLA